MHINPGTANFLSILTSEELDIIDQYWIVKEYDKNSLILKQGQPGTGLFLIKEGSVTVTADFPGAEKFIFGQLQAGDFIGEVSLLDDGPCTATVTTEEICTCLYLDRSVLNALRIAFPLLAYKIVMSIALFSLERLRNIFKTLPFLLEQVKPEYRNAFAYKKHRYLKESRILKAANNKNLPIDDDLKIFHSFAKFTSNEMNILRHYLQSVIVKENTILYKHNDIATALYFIIEGSAQTAYEVEGMQIKVDVIGPGAFLGVLPYFDNADEGLSVIVREYANLLVIKYADLDLLKTLYPNVYYKLYHYLAVSVVALLRSVNTQLLRVKCEQEISLF